MLDIEELQTQYQVGGLEFVNNDLQRAKYISINVSVRGKLVGLEN